MRGRVHSLYRLAELDLVMKGRTFGCRLSPLLVEGILNEYLERGHAFLCGG